MITNSRVSFLVIALVYILAEIVLLVSMGFAAQGNPSPLLGLVYLLLNCILPIIVIILPLILLGYRK